MYTNPSDKAMMAISIAQARSFSSETQKGLISCQTACLGVGIAFMDSRRFNLFFSMGRGQVTNKR
ncbi:hypothetical protein D3C78_1133220 [compost metagenome]